MDYQAYALVGQFIITVIMCLVWMGINNKLKEKKYQKQIARENMRKFKRRL
jgi:hypothetical protein